MYMLNFLDTFSVGVTYSKKIGKFVHTIFNKRPLSTYVCRVLDCAIVFQASMIVLHAFLNSIYFPSLDLRSLTWQYFLHFTMIFWGM